MKRKSLAILLTAAMAATVLAGCSVSSSSTTTTTETTEEAEEVEEAAEEETEEVAEEAEEEVVEEEAAGYEYPDLTGTTLTLTIGSSDLTEGVQAALDQFTEMTGCEWDITIRPGGTDGDNLMKTMMASGELTDIIDYNSGSLLNALNPAEHMYDLSTIPELADAFATMDAAYLTTVTIDGAVYGVPYNTCQGGGMLYYRPAYEELGLEIPTTWAEFVDNCKALQDAGYTPMLGSAGSGSTWTTQVLFLGSNYNVVAEEPTFADDFTAGTAKFATTNAALRTWEHYEDLNGMYNADYLAATYDDACGYLANGEAVHYAMLTQAIPAICENYPEASEDIGVFAIPSDDAAYTGLTVWEPNSYYVDKDTENIEAVTAFLVFATSADYYDTVILTNGSARGPACIGGYTLPDVVPSAIRVDMQNYFDEGKTLPALEFLTPVKGANCEQITTELMSGQSTGAEAAQKYDDDCYKSAVQQGLDW